jgi:hypothetical protein
MIIVLPLGYMKNYNIKMVNKTFDDMKNIFWKDGKKSKLSLKSSVT